MRREFALRRKLMAEAGPRDGLSAYALFLFSPRYARENPAVVDAWVKRASSGPADREIALARIDMVMAHDARARLGAIEQPSLVICGDADFCTPLPNSEELGAAHPRRGVGRSSRRRTLHPPRAGRALLRHRARVRRTLLRSNHETCKKSRPHAGPSPALSRLSPGQRTASSTAVGPALDQHRLMRGELEAVLCPASAALAWIDSLAQLAARQRPAQVRAYRRGGSNGGRRRTRRPPRPHRDTTRRSKFSRLLVATNGFLPSPAPGGGRGNEIRLAAAMKSSSPFDIATGRGDGARRPVSLVRGTGKTMRVARGTSPRLASTPRPQLAPYRVLPRVRVADGGGQPQRGPSVRPPAERGQPSHTHLLAQPRGRARRRPAGPSRRRRAS